MEERAASHWTCRLYQPDRPARWRPGRKIDLVEYEGNLIFPTAEPMSCGIGLFWRQRHGGRRLDFLCFHTVGRPRKAYWAGIMNASDSGGDPRSTLCLAVRVEPGWKGHQAAMDNPASLAMIFQSGKTFDLLQALWRSIPKKPHVLHADLSYFEDNLSNATSRAAGIHSIADLPYLND